MLKKISKHRAFKTVDEILIILFVSLCVSALLAIFTIPVESFWGRKYLPLFDPTLSTFVCDEEIETKYIPRYKQGRQVFDPVIICGKPTTFLEAQNPKQSEKQIYLRYWIVVTLYLTVLLSIIPLTLYGLFRIYKKIKLISPSEK